jgi:hypothetical protein
MTSQIPRDPHPYDHVAPYDAPTSHGDNHAGHGAHRWMMIACCIPMLVIVGVLVATGVAGAGAILYAVVCLAMMALMMRLMPGDHH